MKSADDSQLLASLLAILSRHRGERGDSEGAVETLQRIVGERDEGIALLGRVRFHQIADSPWSDACVFLERVKK